MYFYFRMTDNEAKAHQLFAEAERKKNNPGGFFTRLFGGDTSGTTDLYVQVSIYYNFFHFIKKICVLTRLFLFY